MPAAMPVVENRSLRPTIEIFLADLAANHRSPHTQRAYTTDLNRFALFYTGSLEDITADVLRSYFATLTDRKPATRARAQAAMASLLAWAVCHDLLPDNPMSQLPRVRHDSAAPQCVDQATLATIFAVIPASQRRDHLLFRLLATTGMSAHEALALRVEDVDLDSVQPHVRTAGPHQQWTAIPLTDSALVQELHAYLTNRDTAHRLLFSAVKNGSGGPLTYQAVQARWRHYCARAGRRCTLRQLCHTAMTPACAAGASASVASPPARTSPPSGPLHDSASIDLATDFRGVVVPYGPCGLGDIFRISHRVGWQRTSGNERQRNWRSHEEVATVNERASRAAPAVGPTLSRRQFIEGAGAASGVLALGLAPSVPAQAAAPASAATALSPDQLTELRAILARLLPADELGPGAIEAGVDVYINQALGDVYAHYLPAYQQLLAGIEHTATTYGAASFAELPTSQQDIVLEQVEGGKAAVAQTAPPAGSQPVTHGPEPTADDLAGSFQLLLAHLREGMFGDPMYGGNRNRVGWRLIGFPDVKLSWTAQDQTIDANVTPTGKTARSYGGGPYHGPIPQG